MYVHICIYISVVGSISGPHFGGFRSICGPPGWVNNWSPSETTIKKWRQRISVAQVCREGFKVFVASGVLVENRFCEKGMVAIPFFNFGVVVVVGGC